MWGAIIGDFAGSIYEFEQYKKLTNLEIQELISEKSFYSDDTILTIAILDAILNGLDYEKYLKIYAKNFEDYKPNCISYFNSPFSPGFTKWAKGKGEGNSSGNGAMMRISPVAYLFNTEEEINENAYLATIPSHNSEEARECARLVALIIFWARRGLKKNEIISKLNLEITFKNFERFNMTCRETLGNCLYALFNSNSFDEAIKMVISYGGDTDTNACIVGSMAEALYGIDNNLIKKVSKKLPESFVEKLKLGYLKIKDINTES